MNHRGRFWTFLWIALGIFFLLIATLFFTLPRILNLEWMKRQIQAGVSKEISGHLDYEAISLSYFPRLHIRIRKATVNIAGRLTGRMETLSLYPDILGLFVGKVRIKGARLEAPDFRIKLPAWKGWGNPNRKAPGLEEAVRRVVERMGRMAPGIRMVLERGEVDLWVGGRPYSFESIRARLDPAPNRLKFRLTCRSSLWKALSVNGRFSVSGFKGDIHLRLRAFEPQRIDAPGLSRVGFKMADGRFDLDLRMKMDGFHALRAELYGAASRLVLERSGKAISIQDANLKISMTREGDRIQASLQRMTLGSPKLAMTGGLHVDPTVPSIRLEMAGRDVDAASARRVALALMGDREIVRKIFQVVRAGDVPHISFISRGRSLSDLDEADHFILRGALHEGEIFVPGVEMDLRGVDGEAVISRGVLEGKNLKASWETQKGRAGSLRLGLEGRNPPLHLEILVEADLKRLPSFLRQRLKHGRFLEETGLIDGFEGEALGRLILGERLGSIVPKVDVSSFRLLARYRRLPDTVRIRGGAFIYDGLGIRVRNLSGRMGGSTFSGLAARLDLGDDPQLEISSGGARIALSEIYPWLLSFRVIEERLRGLHAAKGVVGLSGIRFKGPLLHPRLWDFQTQAKLERFAAALSALPGWVTISEGRFHATPEKIRVLDAQIAFRDGSFRASGDVGGYAGPRPVLELDAGGSMGPRSIEWVSDVVHIPEALRIRPPISIPEAHISWEKGAGASFRGDLDTVRGPVVSLDLHFSPGMLDIRRGQIRDEASTAAFFVSLSDASIGLQFSGDLDKRTLDAVFERNRILRGRLEGDFQAWIPRDEPWKFSATGGLRAERLSFTHLTNLPLEIDRIVLGALQKEVAVETASIRLADTSLDLRGTIRGSPEGYSLDMDLSADKIHWGTISKMAQKSRDFDPGRPDSFRRLHGMIRASTERFEYGRLVWSPVRADISFSGDGIRVVVFDAKLCEISTPGVLRVDSGVVALEFESKAENRDLGEAATCLTGTEGLATGRFDLAGEFRARGRWKKIVDSLNGELEISARQGRIYRSTAMAKILGYLSVTEIFRGRLPDMGSEGLDYRSFNGRADVREGRIHLKEGVFDGKTFDMILRGTIDPIAKKMDLKALIAPLKAVDKIVKKIPVVNYILDGRLLSIPVRIKGDFANPTVTALAPSEVGAEMLNTLKRTLSLPMKILSP